jgi:hypothetical protein
MFLKKCRSIVWKASKKERQTNQSLAKDWGEYWHKCATGDVEEWPNMTILIVIGRVPNEDANNMSIMALSVRYKHRTKWERLIGVVKKSCTPKEPFSVTMLNKFHLHTG